MSTHWSCKLLSCYVGIPVYMIVEGHDFVSTREEEIGNDPLT